MHMHNQVGGAFLLSQLKEKVSSVKYCSGRQLFTALQREEERGREERRDKGVLEERHRVGCLVNQSMDSRLSCRERSPSPPAEPLN